jgi:hypothetical protein
LKDEAIGVLPIGEAEGALLFLFRFKRLYEKRPRRTASDVAQAGLGAAHGAALPVPPACRGAELRRCRWAWGDLPSRPSRTRVRGHSFKVLCSVLKVRVLEFGPVQGSCATALPLIVWSI